MAKTPIQIFKVRGNCFTAFDLLNAYKFENEKIAVSFKIGKKRKLKKFRVRSYRRPYDEREEYAMTLVRGDGTPNKRYFDDIVYFEDTISYQDI